MIKRILITTALVAAATPAMAGNTTSSNGGTVDFSGNRATVCEVRNYENVVDFGALGEFGEAGNITDTASIYCNVRFNASIQSDNGFLQLDTLVADALPTSQSNTAAQGYSGFAAALDYSVNISGLGTADTTLIGTSAVPLGTNLDPINQTATLTYDTVTSSLPLLGGNYADSVTLTLTPQAF